MEPFFSTSELSVGYNGKPLIHDIEMRLAKGRILALIGPNGSGKSTILKTITKYLTSLHGTVFIGGRELSAMTSGELARQVSVVLTTRMKTECLTCEDVVETGRYPYTGKLGILSPQDHIAVENAMALVHATELRNQNFMQISDGQRQRVLLARAIAQEPEIIVLDEPTTFLDIHYKLELMGILQMLARDKGIAVIVSLHELDMAQRIADDVLCVKGETIADYGAAEDIFREDLIRDLYDLDNGSFNPLFGSLEMAKPTGEPRLFVIAGGGTGISVYRMLQKKRIPFITGILHENDVDYQVAKALASEVIAECAFQSITDETFHIACDKLATCTEVQNCLTEYGEMNRHNEALYKKALQNGCTSVSYIGDNLNQYGK